MRELLLGIALLVFAKPIIAPIAFGTILAIALHPIYKLHKRRYFGAFLVVVSMVFLVYTFYYLSITVYDQVEYVAELYNNLNPELQLQIVELGSNIPFKDYAISIARSLPSVLVNFLFFFIFSFYFLVDGHKIKEGLYKSLPKSKAEKLVKEGWKNLRSVVSGVFITKTIYIALSTTLLSFASAPAPFLYSVLAALFGILPIFGAWMVYAYVVYLNIVAGRYIMAAALIAFQLIWDIVFENFYFKIKFRGTLHPAILLGSMATGIVYFGFSGLLVGPLIATVLLTVARVKD